MPVGCTAGHGATADQRLTAIGNGWDLNVVTIIMSHTQLRKDAAIAKTENLQPEGMATVLMQLGPEVRQQHLQLLQQYYAAVEPTCADARSFLVPPQNINHSSAAAHQMAQGDPHHQDDAHHQAAFNQMESNHMATTIILAIEEALSPAMLVSVYYRWIRQQGIGICKY